MNTDAGMLQSAAEQGALVRRGAGRTGTGPAMYAC